MWARERCPAPFSPLAICGRWERWPWGSRIQRDIPAPHLLSYSRAGPKCEDLMCASPDHVSAGELTLPFVCCVVAQTKKRCLPPILISFTFVRWENLPQGHESGRTVPVSHQLQHAGDALTLFMQQGRVGPGCRGFGQGSPNNWRVGEPAGPPAQITLRLRMRALS